MAVPTFNGFSFNDTNWITERIQFKDFAEREVSQARINRREGIKILGTEFVKKEITLSGKLVASSASSLQTILDAMKRAVTIEEGNLVCETGRTYRATVSNLTLPDEHYNQSVNSFEVTFVTSDPFSEGSLLTVVTPVPSGLTTFSGTVNISGTYFARPSIVYTPPSATGNTLIKAVTMNHTPTGQSILVSGFNSSGVGGLTYQNQVTINCDDFTSFDGGTQINNSGAFPRWDPGVNAYTLVASGRAFPGGNVSVSYQPRYL